MVKYALLPLALSIASVGCKKEAPHEECSNQKPATTADTPEKAAKEKVAQENAWIPNEHATGKKRWKDSMVYVDGVPKGALWFAELPQTIKPVWVEEEDEVPGPDRKMVTKIVRDRYYRISDYLEAVGVDLKKINEVHVYGGKHYALRITGKEFLKVKDTILIRFGRGTAGKALYAQHPDIPYQGNTAFDHVRSVLVYIDKKPPEVDKTATVRMNGKVYGEVPYFGAPLRGGIRVYKDDVLATIVKRKDLVGADKLATKKDGQVRWDLFKFLESRDVDTKGVQLVEVIHDERRGHRFEAQALKGLYFLANSRKSGEVLLGDGSVPAQAIALYTTPQPPREVIKPGDP